MVNDNTIKINLSTSGGANTQTVNFINLYNFSELEGENLSNRIETPDEFIKKLGDDKQALLIDYPNNSATGTAKLSEISGYSQIFKKEVIGDVKYTDKK